MNSFTYGQYEALAKRFNQLKRIRNKSENLFKNDCLNTKDISQIYRGIFFDVYTSFESFLEEVFIGLLQGAKSRGHVARPLLSIKSSKMAKRLLFGEKKYLDWFPYKERTMKRAKIYFKKGDPFTSRLDENDLYFMTKELFVVRNVLSHRSSYAHDKFDKMVNEKYPHLNNRERNPDNFIRYIYRRNPKETILEKYIYRISKIAHNITR